MLFGEIRGYIKPQAFQLRYNVNDLSSMETKTFIDTLKLYIHLSGILVDLGYTELEILPGDIRKEEELVFNREKFNRMLIGKGSLLMQPLILEDVLRKCASYLEGYIEQFLLEKPDYKIFREFSKNNFTLLHRVFKESVDGAAYLFTYKKGRGEILVKDRSGYNTMKKEEVELVYDSYEFPKDLSNDLIELKEYNFPTWRKYVLEAVETIYRGEDIMKNTTYMTSLGTDLEKFRNKAA